MSYSSSTMNHTPYRFTWKPAVGMWLFVLALLGLGQGPAAANSNRHWSRYNGWEVTQFQVVGLPSELEDVAVPRLALNGRRKLLKRTRPLFKVSLLAEDVARLKLLLAQEGYPLPRISVVDTPLPESRQVALQVEVDPGQPVRVRQLVYNGWPESLPKPQALDDDSANEGTIFRDEAVHRGRDRIEMHLRDVGYAGAMVDLKVVPVDGYQVDLVFSIQAGDYNVFSDLEISGCSDELVPVARRVADFPAGEEYSLSTVEAMAANMRWTQLFGEVTMESVANGNGEVTVRAELSDARMRSTSLSVGTWSDNPWMVKVGWIHRNLFGRGVGFDSNASVATHENNLGAGVFWLGWLTPRARTRVGLEYLEENEDAYASTEERLDIVQAFRPNNRDILKVGISTSHIDVAVFHADPGEIPEEQGYLLEFWCDWKWDKTDNPIQPSKGYYLKLSGTIAPPIHPTEAPYYSGQADLAVYKEFLSDFVLTGRMRMGLGKPIGETEDILSNRRFYAGGFNSMRGYSRRSLGPKDTQGNPRGGQAVALGGLELRFPIWKILRGAVFVDTGQVWRYWEDMGLGTIGLATGASLDLITPIGPIRVNHAWNRVNLQDGEPERLWLGGIGYSW